MSTRQTKIPDFFFQAATRLPQQKKLQGEHVWHISSLNIGIVWK